MMHTIRLSSPASTIWSCPTSKPCQTSSAWPRRCAASRVRVRSSPDSETEMYSREAAFYGGFGSFGYDDIPVDMGEQFVGPVQAAHAESKVQANSGLPPPADPEVRLVTKLRVQDTQQAFWNDFMFKCRLAWDVFFPSKPEVLSPAGAGRSRLQMIIMSDRCGLDLPTLMQMKNSSMAALASEHGWQDMTEVELQIASVKPSGERVQMSLPLSSLPSTEQLRDPDEYNFEDGLDGSDDEDDDSQGNTLRKVEQSATLQP